MAAIAYWLFREQRYEWMTRHGVQMLARVERPLDVRLTLDRWGAETQRYWQGRESDYLTYLFERHSLEDPRIRRLVSHVADVDFGERIADWQRWRRSFERMRVAESPVVGKGEQVALKLRWQAPIGQTGAFSNLLAIDQRIYVATLGGGFGRDDDESDGVVMVDGASGAARLIYAASGKAPRDVIGLAAADGYLYVACRNGQLSCIDLEGRPQWSVTVAEGLASGPMAIDVNRNAVADIAVVTRAGRLVLLSGVKGRTVWSRDLQGAGGDAGAGSDDPELSAISAWLALASPASARQLWIIAATRGGFVYAIGATDGKPLWSRQLPAGIVAAPLTQRNAGEDHFVVATLDEHGNVWVSPAASAKDEMMAHWRVAGYGAAAGLRSFAIAEQPACLLASDVGQPQRWAAALSALDAGGVRWRVSLGGLLYAAPAVADLNADGKPEFVTVTCMNTDGQHAAELRVTSSEGHCLLRAALSAAVLCAPAVADVDGDGLLELLIADRAGVLSCYAVERFGPVTWGLYRGDIRNSGNAESAYSYSQTPAGFQAKWKPR